MPCNVWLACKQLFSMQQLPAFFNIGSRSESTKFVEKQIDQRIRHRSNHMKNVLLSLDIKARLEKALLQLNNLVNFLLFS